LGQTQDAWKPDEPRQQPRWRLCRGRVLMTYPLPRMEEWEEPATVTLQKAEKRAGRLANTVHVKSERYPRRARAAGGNPLTLCVCVCVCVSVCVSEREGLCV
jgi:hypothetical protein